MYITKKDVLLNWSELELTEFGDFIVQKDYVKDYKIIDFHCHLFAGLKECFPKLLRNELKDMDASFFDESYAPFSLNQFDINKVTFTDYPKTLLSTSGVGAKIKFLKGGFVIRKSTPERMLRDMRLNNISKAVVLQINPPNRNSAREIDRIVKENEGLITFGSIHPDDSNISGRIGEYLSMDIKGWKVAPHVGGFNIECKNSLELLSLLADTNLPILSCSGLGVPEWFMGSGILSKKQKYELTTQRISNFNKVLERIPNTTFILAHAGVFEIDGLIELMHKYPSTYTDISTQPPHNIKKLIDTVGSERLLFGTDYPFWNHAFSIVSVLRATSKDSERRNIFSQNARRILGD